MERDATALRLLPNRSAARPRRTHFLKWRSASVSRTRRHSRERAAPRKRNSVHNGSIHRRTRCRPNGGKDVSIAEARARAILIIRSSRAESSLDRTGGRESIPLGCLLALLVDGPDEFPKFPVINRNPDTRELQEAMVLNRNRNDIVAL